MTSLRLLGSVYVGLILLIALILAFAAWWLYRRELRKNSFGKTNWLLPLLRALAIFLIVLTLAEPTLEMRQREGTPGKVHFLLDDSQSMAVDDAVAESDSPSRVGTTRLERAAIHLLEPSVGVLPQLIERFELTVSRFGSEGPVDNNHPNELVKLWSSSMAENEALPVSPLTWLPSDWGKRSAIGDSIANAMQPSTTNDQAKDTANSVVVLLSDGQHNAGQGPLKIIREQITSPTPVYVVGYGAATEPPDIALVGWDLPQRVYRSDTLSGSLIVNQTLPMNSRWKAEILHDGQVIWADDLESSENGRREIPFSFAVAPLFDKQLKSESRDATYEILPIPLEARVSTTSIEANLNNNRRRTSIDAVAQKSKLLLVDGRSRWETRFLRNLFERDPAWEIDTVLASEAWNKQHNHADSTGADSVHATLPTSRDQLFEYNLVVLGDAPASLWSSEQLGWLRDFVERGGGLVFIDGNRNHLQDTTYQPIRPLLPIRWQSSPPAGATDEVFYRTELSDAGRGLSALQLSSRESQDSKEIWRQLPLLQWMSRVEPLPGSEVLLKATSGTATHPLLVTRRFGAGRVLFFASDESWRWRYKVADLIHQRFWNQLARWTMRIPLSVQGEFVSLDTGASTVAIGKPIEVRCSLREVDGTPALDKAVTAIIRRDGEFASRIPLNSIDELPGYYSHDLLDLQPGDYQVQVEAAGYPAQALAVESRFTVESEETGEMDHIAQDVSLLQQVAKDSGGQYLNETEVSRLVDLLAPHSSGRIVQSTTILWQSCWWFSTAMLLLIVEWILRKRSGLI